MNLSAPLTPEQQRQADAYNFFRELEIFLNQRVPPPQVTNKTVSEIVSQSKNSSEGHKRFPEGALLNEYITPNIHAYLVESCGMSSEKARESLLSESYRSLPKFSSGTPSRLAPTPFQKALGKKPGEIMAMWRGEKGGLPVSRPAPDIALRSPCPFPTLIEGKYFSQGGNGAADTALVTDLYQAFFYLGLSRLPETETHPAWDYEYACLLAYDGSDDATLRSAWQSLDSEVKSAFWEGANIYVMILRGDDAED